MTLAITFHFTSPQFLFESGQIIFSKGGRLRTTEEPFPVGELTRGSIEGVLVEGPIEFDAMLSAIKVIRRGDGRIYEVVGLFVSGTLTENDLSSGRVVVALHLPLLLIIRVEDSSGRAVSGAQINIAQPSVESTWEMTVNESGELVIFGTPGPYYVTLFRVGDRWLRDDRVKAKFEVDPAEQGERVIVMRAP